MKLHTTILMALMVVLSACSSEPLFPDNETGNNTMEETIPVDTISEINVENTNNAEENMMQEETTEETNDIKDYSVVIEATEGELVKLETKAQDPDGDKVTLTFSEPFDENGEWQTKEGDAGEYTVTITASDGKEETTALVLVKVKPVNKAPVIEGPSVIQVLEGETVDLGVLTINDPEGDEFVVSYSGWMKSSTYKTGFDDAGRHKVVVIAEDVQGNIAQKEITVVVENQNRKPRLRIDETKLEVVEGDVVSIKPITSDADGDEVTLTFSEPFDENGEWQTKEGDAGEYTVIVTAHDGIDETEREVQVIVLPKNRAPVITINDVLVFKEGETINLEDFLKVTDPEGDDVEVTYSGWLTQPVKELSYEDAGEYTVTITASDGDKTAEKTIKIKVENVNRPPEFVWP